MLCMQSNGNAMAPSLAGQNGGSMTMGHVLEISPLVVQP